MATVALPRSTPATSLNPSQSQNAAPVFEYRCMFTHDIRKKAKKWHDGSLRFHTFNKRVMVYDDTKNLVGSLHYRSQEDLVEGLELSLDSHVLVQVEEQLGESSTDLTPLLSRQKQDGNNQSSKPDPPTRATLSRINAANTQIKPKSIKELLATSQTALARPRPLLKSPFDQRHHVETQPIEPDPKRRKIAHGKENATQSTTATRPATSSAVPATNTAQNVGIVDNNIAEVSSDGPPSSPPTDRRKKPRVQATTPKAVSVASPRLMAAKATKESSAPAERDESDRRRRDDEPVRAPISRKKQASNLEKEPLRKSTDEDTAVVRSHVSTSSSASAINSSRSQIRHSGGPRSSLKFAAEKPRPKLMYRALIDGTSRSVGANPDQSTAVLPTGQDPVESGNDPEPVRRRPRSNMLLELDRTFAPSQTDREVEVLSKDASNDAAMQDHVPEQSPARLESLRSSPDQAATPVMSSPPNGDIVETVPDSPLFLSRPTSQASPASTQNIVPGGGHTFSLTQALQTIKSNEPDEPAPNSSQPRSKRSDTSQTLSSPTSSPIFQRLMSARPSLEENVRAQSPEGGISNDGSVPSSPSRSPSSSPRREKKSVPPLPPVFPAHIRPFRRVVSESMGTTRASPDILPGDDDSDVDVLDQMPVHKLHQNHSARKEDPPAHPQSFSDPIEVHMTSPAPYVASSSVDIDENLEPPDDGIVSPEPPAPLKTTDHVYIPVEESGPWTSTEAFLLFDRWPPGRQKPPYATDLSGTASMTNTNDGGGIGSRPQTLGINAMSKKKYGIFGSAKFVSQR